MKKQNQNGSALVVIVIILAVAIIGTLGFVLWQNFLKPKPATETSQTNKTTTSTVDPYKDWKTYTSTASNYQIKYPSTWLLVPETSTDGPYIRNLDPTTTGGGYPAGYINVSILKYTDNSNFSGSTATQWYDQLGTSDLSMGPITYKANTVGAYTVNNMAAKKTIASYDETDEAIFVLKDSKLYEINLYPANATNDATVQKMLTSFTFL
jgi:cytoskeletal protein RodZ